jgi:tetratricopeptide (TPR) repeat protein/TolB-like protein/tRNA A-37 threonylcarbamoyl transferase component Bud32
LANPGPKCGFDNLGDTLYCSKCGTNLSSSKDASVSFTETLETGQEELSTGSTFAGRYQIVEELGRGGMGKVYKAYDKEIEAKIALKLIKPEITADKNTIERFRNELRIARDISHKNICRMYDLGREGSRYFITMEYVSGEDLKNMIRMSGQLSVGTAVSIAKQVCEGLAEAHGHGVIHRDLKPSNIMIDRNGNVRIMDFGIARSIKAKGITGAGVMIGTPEYMSPEQVEGKEVDQRADIYSLGIILYEMLTGRVPFEGDTPFTVGVKHKSEIPKDPKEVNANIPDDLSSLTLRCLEKEKEKRYQSAEELRTELEKVEKGIPTTERAIPKPKPLTSKEITIQFKVKKLLAPALIAIVFIAGAITLWQVLSSRKPVPVPSDKPSLAVVYFENISGDPTLDDWKTGLPELIITDLSQSRFLNVLGGDRIFGILKKLNLLEAKKYSSDDLIKVAREGEVQYILSGGLMKAGSKIILTARLQKPDKGEVVETKKMECSGEEEIPAKVDELTRMIKADLNLTPRQISSDIDKSVGQITTSSPEAFKYYSEARKFHYGDEYLKAIQLYEKAIALDPEFAMAYRGLAMCYRNLGYPEKQKEYIQKALASSDHASDRERLLIQGQVYGRSENTFDKAIASFSQLLELYPGDLIATNSLGVIYSDLEEWEEAAAKFTECLKVQKDILNSGNLAGQYQALGRYDQARKVLEDYLQTVSDSARVRIYLTRNFLYQGQYENALNEADRAFLLSPGSIETYYLKGDIYHLQGNFEAAEKEYQRILEKGDKSYHFGARNRLVVLYHAQGRFKKAKEEIGQAISIADELKNTAFKANAAARGAYVDLKSGNLNQALEEIESAIKVFGDLENMGWLRFLMACKGVIYIESGAVDQAERVDRELKALIQKSPNKKAVRYYLWLEGWIDLKKGHYSKAIGNFEKAKSFLKFQSGAFDEHAFFLDGLASAYQKAGDLAKAAEEYERITSLTSGRMAYGDIYAKAFYMLGKIAESQGEKAKARELYRKFLDLWKDADPGIPEVEDARKRLAEL